MRIWLFSMISVFIVSGISLVAVVFLSIDENRLEKILQFLVSFAVGGLFGDALIHLIPESFETLGFGLNTSLFILLGVMIFFILEKFIHWRHCHTPGCDEHSHPIATMTMIGDGVHNFIDGMLIGGSFLVTIPLGITTTIAVILHEIPQEIGNFGVLVHGGFSTKKALLYNFLVALTAVLGTVFALTVGPWIKGFNLVLLPITAGGFIYVAGSDLIPELKHEIKLSHATLQLFSIIFGIGLMSLLILME